MDLPTCASCGNILPDDSPLNHRCPDTLETKIREAIIKTIEDSDK